MQSNKNAKQSNAKLSNEKLSNAKLSDAKLSIAKQSNAKLRNAKQNNAFFPANLRVGPQPLQGNDKSLQEQRVPAEYPQGKPLHRPETKDKGAGGGALTKQPPPWYANVNNCLVSQTRGLTLVSGARWHLFGALFATFGPLGPPSGPSEREIYLFPVLGPV